MNIGTPMPIKDIDSVQQALASIKLESLDLSEKLQKLLKDAIFEGKLSTTDLLNALHEG